MAGWDAAVVLWIVLGLALGALFVLLARALARRERLVLALGLAVAAAVYLGFALASGRQDWILHELLGLAVFGAMAWAGLRKLPWLLPLGWLLHVGWDVGIHGLDGGLIAPAWYVQVCIGFDLLVAAYAWRGAKPAPGRGSSS